ncbi:MAG TPA: type I phosphomannose isomerase catalytic subunit [Verrucomicrobiae bacterium]|nr:type I phosphomannose isomerase catalytic subunit [Verrucomicrobiae bacterium]
MASRKPPYKNPVLYPLIFHPIFKERVWGGRELEKLYGKKLPVGKIIGESWEISDRPGDESVVANGKFAGKNLRWLMENFPREILGNAKPANENRFPILCKILDARDKLSLQVHPPANKAAGLKGEPKTEMWFIAAAAPGAELFVGLKHGVTRAEFEKKIQGGNIADCFHRVPVHAGDTMFLPSGRVHAIGAGLVIFEIQQNSDTTYRVFDWNRVGLDGKPRELHIAQSLASIDFNDFEPKLVSEKFSGDEKIKSRSLVHDPLFNVEHLEMKNGAVANLKEKKLQIIAAVSGQIEIKDNFEIANLSAGQFCLIPASLKRAEILAKSEATLLCVEAN